MVGAGRGEVPPTKVSALGGETPRKKKRAESHWRKKDRGRRRRGRGAGRICLCGRESTLNNI